MGNDGLQDDEDASANMRERERVKIQQIDPARTIIDPTYHLKQVSQI